jgi:cobalt-zinc-cadmium efflux system membrane fusion protein
VKFVCVLAAALIIAPVLAGAQPQSPGEEQVVVLDPSSLAASQIRLATVTRKPVLGEIDATASIEPDTAAVAEVTTRIPARVVKLIAEPGQTVAPGQPLAILSSIELGQAKTEFLKARALETIARQNLDREQSLYEKKISPLKDVLKARAEYDTAVANYRAARETLRLLVPSENPDRLTWSTANTSLSDFPLTSPIAGTLVRRNLTLGAAVSSGQSLMTVINLDEVWVITNIFESDLAAIRIGDKVSITVDAYPGHIFTGRLSYIGDEVDRRTRTVQARISVPNPEHLLKPGMFAHARIASAAAGRDTIVIPQSAVFSNQGSSIVFVQAGPNRYLARTVELGGRAGNEVEVRGGLNIGDRIVVQGGLPLKALLLNRGPG